MTTRDNFADELKAYLDNELPLAQRVAVRLHVAGCRACQEELKQMAQITEELRATEAHDTDVSPGIDPTPVAVPGPHGNARFSAMVSSLAARPASSFSRQGRAESFLMRPSSR